jgi:hypothetical protein
MSPWGLHAYRSVLVPYCQFLFAKQDMDAFVKEARLEPIDVYCNGWRPAQFRDIFAHKKVDLVSYTESRNISAIDLENNMLQFFGTIRIT